MDPPGVFYKEHCSKIPVAVCDTKMKYFRKKHLKLINTKQ